MGRRPSVLVIESQPNTRTLLEMTLSHEGLRVYSAVNLDSALLQLRILKPDLIIVGLDHQATQQNGTAGKIRELSRSPLLALGGECGASLGPEFADVVPYPINAGQLCSKVARLLGCSCQRT